MLWIKITTSINVKSNRYYLIGGNFLFNVKSANKDIFSTHQAFSVSHNFNWSQGE